MLPRYFTDETAARRYLEKVQWPNGVTKTRTLKQRALSFKRRRKTIINQCFKKMSQSSAWYCNLFALISFIAYIALKGVGPCLRC
jgi:hypothetical protein